MSNWYAVQVTTGKEENTAYMCRQMLPQTLLEECFIPYYERMRRYEGAWHREERPMFPGYLFFITGQVDNLFHALKAVPELTRILGDGERFIPLEEEEIQLLLQIGGNEHKAEMSQGVIEGDKVIITSGPLSRIEGTIKKIDRHKRIAVVELWMFGREQKVTMGLEVVRKVKEREEKKPTD